MVDEIIKYFREKSFIEFQNKELNLLSYVFGSPEQIFGISFFENEESLISDWEKVSEEFAIRIQSQLIGTLYNLKWDMYLILVVDDFINNMEIRKKIENDRMYFRKIVLAKNLENFKQKLPIELELDNSDQLEIFSDSQFLNELREIVSSDVESRLNIDIYQEKSIEEANDIVFLKPYENKGVYE